MEWVRILVWPACAFLGLIVISEIVEEHFKYKNKKLDLQKNSNTSPKKENDSPEE